MDFGPKHEMKLFLAANPQRVSLQVEEAANVKSCLLVRFEPSRPQDFGSIAFIGNAPSIEKSRPVTS